MLRVIGKYVVVLRIVTILFSLPLHPLLRNVLIVVYLHHGMTSLWYDLSRVDGHYKCARLPHRALIAFFEETLPI